MSKWGKSSRFFRDATWERKARHNLLWAIQSTDDVFNIPNKSVGDRSIDAVDKFWTKGQHVFNQHLKSLSVEFLNDPDFKVAEFGCGVGRILVNFSEFRGRVVGFDISKTQIRVAKKLNKKIDFQLIKSSTFSHYQSFFNLVFSFAVVKHIGELSKFEVAVRNMCKILKPNGVLALNLHCQDLATTPIGKTINFENFSVHFDSHGSVKSPFLIHRQDANWSGVYVGFEYIEALLWSEGLQIDTYYHHNFEVKPGNVWLICTKKLPKS